MERDSECCSKRPSMITAAEDQAEIEENFRMQGTFPREEMVMKGEVGLTGDLMKKEGAGSIGEILKTI